MKLPVAIHKDEGSVFGVTVPDVPGCFSYGESVEEALQNVEEALRSHLEIRVEDGETVEIMPSSIQALQADADYTGAVWALVDVDLSWIDSTPERVNISLPRYVLRRIDEYTKQHHETRSGFLARVAMNALGH